MSQLHLFKLCFRRNDLWEMSWLQKNIQTNFYFTGINVRKKKKVLELADYSFFLGGGKIPKNLRLVAFAANLALT